MNEVFHDFVALAYETRLAQKRFLRARDNLADVKRLEQELDEAVESHYKPEWQDAEELRW